MSKPKSPQTQQTSGLGLEGMGNLSALLNDPTAASTGAPLELDMGLIDEDPNQPRTANNPGFGDESLNELAASIKLRGVKTPISVRDNPSAAGRYLINHGHRRFRGSTRAGKLTIPGFIDNDYNDADQVVENLQRNELTAREIANYIGREMAKGNKKGDIAKAISKSAAFVSQHVTLLDLPDPIAQAFNSGRVKDVTLINELVTAFKKKPGEVEAWLADEDQEITRGSVHIFREFLADKQESESPRHSGGVDVGNKQMFETANEGAKGGAGGDGRDGDGSSESKTKEEKATDPTKIKKAIVQVQHDGRTARLILSRRPPGEGLAWLKYDDDGHEFEATLSEVQLLAVLEG